MATVVFVHAHPDDEALLTGGSMAHLARAGHRVVLITATDGGAGLAASDIKDEHDLGQVRSAELAQSCRELGVAAFHNLGYADSGLAGDAATDGRTRFVDADVQVAGGQIAELLQQEAADVVVSYDPAGGYGHPDHVKVHAVCQSAIEQRPTPLVESTIPREPILAGVKALYAFRWLVPALKGLDMSMWNNAFRPKAEIVYRINVRADADAKRAALRAHASQATADEGPRTISVLLKLPEPLFKRLLGTEWFAAPARSTWTEAQKRIVNSAFGQPLRKTNT